MSEPSSCNTFQRALNPADGGRVTTFVPVGPDYCVRHHGIREEDEERCDFADGLAEDEGACDLRPLGWMEEQ